LPVQHQLKGRFYNCSSSYSSRLVQKSVNKKKLFSWCPYFSQKPGHSHVNV